MSINLTTVAPVAPDSKMEPTASRLDHQSLVANSLPKLRVVVVGLGNIGSFLAMLLAPWVSLIRLVDHDVVDDRNLFNQFYRPQDVGRSKVEVTAERIGQLAPELQVECQATDLRDVFWQDYADADVVFGGLDSLGARRQLSELVYTLGVPYIDGAVGQPTVIRTQLVLPGHACLQCNWGDDHYRQLATEYSCRPGDQQSVAPTAALGCAGAATASLMVAQCLRLFTDDSLRQSCEVNGDLSSGRMLTGRRRRNDKCRFGHETVSHLIRLNRPFDLATVDTLLAAVTENFQGQSVQLEFRRGILDDGFFGANALASLAQLARCRDRPLHELGLTQRDRVAVRLRGQSRLAHVCFDFSYQRHQSHTPGGQA